MNGTVRIGRYTVVRDGKRTTVTGPGAIGGREKFKQLKAQADAMLMGRAAAGLPASDDALPEQVAYKPRAPISAEIVAWKDASRPVDGGPMPNSGPLARTWGGGNCLKACIASLLGASIEKVPDPGREYSQGPEGWLDRYSKRLGDTTGYRLEKLPASMCPPRNHGLWIATIDERPDPSDHCVVAREGFVVHDPSGSYLGQLPLDRIVDGLLIVPTQRILPVLSPLGSGHAVIAA